MPLLVKLAPFSKVSCPRTTMPPEEPDPVFSSVEPALHTREPPASIVILPLLPTRSHPLFVIFPLLVVVVLDSDSLEVGATSRISPSLTNVGPPLKATTVDASMRTVPPIALVKTLALSNPSYKILVDVDPVTLTSSSRPNPPASKLHTP